MQGQVLGIDPHTNEGQISGADGQRYAFGPSDWKITTRPMPGQHVDFEPSDGRALAIYAAQNRLAAAYGGYPAAMRAPKDRTSAALLAFFLGGFGAHKFYLDQPGAGVAMLLLSLFGVFLLFIPNIAVGIWALVDFIVLLSMSDAEFHARYSR